MPRRLLIALRQDHRGASALEMAIIAPMLAGMLMFAVDLGNAWNFRLRLERAAQRGLDYALAPGRVMTDYSGARTEMTTTWGGSYTSAVVSNWLECDGVKQANFTGACAAGQQTARFVKLSIKADYTPSFGWGTLFNLGSGNVVNLTGDAVARVQ